MKDLLIGLLALGSISSFASNFNQVLIYNSEVITQIKSEGGSELSGCFSSIEKRTDYILS